MMLLQILAAIEQHPYETRLKAVAILLEMIRNRGKPPEKTTALPPGQ